MACCVDFEHNNSSRSRPSSSSPQKVYTFFCWGGFAPPDPPFKSAAVAASASQVRTLKPSRPLSRPPGVGSTWTWTGPGPGREALGPGQGLAVRPWQPGRHTFCFLTNIKKTRFFLFVRKTKVCRPGGQGLPASPWPGPKTALARSNSKYFPPLEAATAADLT